MLCLVAQPNNLLLDIFVSPKAKGQECLDKVCDKLGIIEVDYFGLQYKNKNGDFYWLNLRNQIRQQIHHNSTTEPIWFYLKVKFYVPPHLIQQDSTRHQFYLNICQSLTLRYMRVRDVVKQAKLIALIAQSESGDYRKDSFDLRRLYLKWIFLFEPNSTKSDETKSSRRKRQRHSSGSSDDYELEQPMHNSKDSLQLTLDKFDNELDSLSRGHADLFKAIVDWHQQFAGYLKSKAESIFLKETCELEDVGTDYYAARVENGGEERCKIGIGTHGIMIHGANKKLVNYSSLLKVQTSTHFFTLKFTDNGDVIEKKFKLSSTKNANALYRVVTEKHVFYSCDTVGDSVFTQCIRDLTGMFWSITPSIFKDGPEVGKNFVFDIRRTLRQFYDDVQRTMYKVKNRINDKLELDHLELSNDVCQAEPDNHHSGSSADLQQPLIEEKLCRICFDQQASIAFSPCGHMMSCELCGNDCDTCPICRSQIGTKLRIFF